jgi:hypothetical protein
MSGQEISFIIDWGVWLPVAIAAVSLILTVRQMRKKSGRDGIDSLEKKIDRAHRALTECESNLKQCGHEKDELRREKFALLEQIAGMAKSNSEGG